MTISAAAVPISLSPGTWPVEATLAPSSSTLDLGGSRGMPGERASIKIAGEAPGDVAARDRLLDRAMKPNWRRKSSEKIRRGRLPALALVARGDDDAVIGTVRLWNIEVGTRSVGDALLLGPLAVDPAARSGGIGASLMHAAIEQAREGGYGVIVLVGDAQYYERFGFTAQKTTNIAMPGPFEKHRLLALELRPGALDGANGVIRPTGRKLARAA